MASTSARQPKTKKGKRVLEKRAPKQVEDPKQVLILQGNKVSQVVKNVLTDISRLKHEQAVSKKRPHNLVLGRTFDGQLLDMVELGVSEHTPISHFSAASKLLPGSTPAFVFPWGGIHTERTSSAIEESVAGYFSSIPSSGSECYDHAKSIRVHSTVEWERGTAPLFSPTTKRGGE